MAWVAAIVGGVLSIGGGMMGEKDAKKASAKEERLTERELRLAETQSARADRMFDEYLTTYLPNEREFVRDAFTDEKSPEAAAGRATTDVRVASEGGRERSMREARALGIDPSSGAFQARESQRTLRDASTEVAARDRARTNAQDQNFQRQYTALSIGRGLPSTAGALTSSAQRGVAGLSDAAARRTDQANAVVDAGYNNGARQITDGISMYRQQQQKNEQAGTQRVMSAGTRTDMSVSPTEPNMAYA